MTGSETVPEEFFAVMERNLQQSRMRLIFFMDDSPLELRSTVEFLNGQFKDVEVLIVEARQYQYDDARIVVPCVFGFTEEARVAKRESKMEIAGASPAKGEAAFWEAIEISVLRPEWKKAIHEFVARAGDAPGCELRWLRMCLIELRAVVPQRTLYSIGRDGSLQLNIACWKPKDGGELTEQQSAAQKDFFKELQAMFDYSSEYLQSKQYPMVAPERWIPSADQLAELIERLGAASSTELETVES